MSIRYKHCPQLPRWRERLARALHNSGFKTIVFPTLALMSRKYGFGGKEQQEEFGIAMYDF